MTSDHGIKEVIAYILLIGMLLSTCLVMIGAALYLQQVGNHPFSQELIYSRAYQPKASVMIPAALAFNPLAIIELGFIILVTAQIVRVAILTGFYAYIRDYWFTAMSLFITLVLIYSLVWKH